MWNKKHTAVAFAITAVLIIVGVGYVRISNEMNSKEKTTDTSLSGIRERGKLVVGTYPVVEPMTFVDKSGQVVGFDMDMVKAVAADIGVPVEIKQINFQDLIGAAETGQIDLIACVMTITPERSERILFSIPYFNTGQMIITLKNNTDIRGPDDLTNKRVGVQKDTTAEKAAMKYVNHSLIVSYDDWNLAPEDLKKGKTDAILFDIGAFSLVKNNPELKIVGTPLTQDFYGLATKKGNDAFMEEVNKVLREIKRNGKLKELEDKWLR
jgi:polar amino acid transport system substrate-binding protein